MAVARYLIENCPDGLTSQTSTFDEIKLACPDASASELLDGLGDLENYGLIKAISFLGQPDEYQLTEYSYEVFDLGMIGSDPMADARALASLMVEQRLDCFTAHELEAALGWGRRRFNPALRIVAGMIRLKGDELQPHFVTTQLNPTNAEFSELRRFAAST